MSDDKTAPKKIIFVGGYPRSGTTLTHALLCTSNATSNTHPEVSFLKGLVQAYNLGMDNWEPHTQFLFENAEAFRKTFAKSFDMFLNEMGKTIGVPDVWCMKDPLLTPHFHWTGQLLRDRVQFVTVVRHPYDTIRSNLEVRRKMGEPCEEAHVQALAEHYNTFYMHVKNPTLRDRLFYFRYEDIDTDKVVADLRAFTGLHDIAREQIWAGLEQVETSADPWFSPKYLGKIDLTPRLDPLETRFKKIIDRTCTAVLSQFY